MNFRCVQIVSIVLYVGCLNTPGAKANPINLYGFGPSSIATGGAGVALSEDFSAVYYNPANLSIFPQRTLGFYLAYARPELSLEGLKAETEAFSTVDSTKGVGLGLNFLLGTLFKRNVSLGIGLYLDSSGLGEITFITPTTPHFVMYEGYPQRIGIYGGLSFEILPRRLSVGFGAQILANVGHALIDLELDFNTYDVAKRDLLIRLGYLTVPLFGLHWQIGRGWHFGFAYREAFSLVFTLPALVNLTDVEGTTGQLGKDVFLEFFLIGETFFTPDEYAWGIGYKSDNGANVGLDVTWMRWSQTPPISLTVGIELLNSELFDASGPDPNFHDTLVFRLGGAYPLGESFKLKAGYAYQPTPVPDQNEETNFVDNTKHILSTGLSYRFGHIDVSLFLQEQILVPRNTLKTDENSTSGSYRAQGAVTLVGTGLQFHFE